MKEKEKKIKIQKSSGNIFQDLGYNAPDETLAKVDLVIKINQIIKDKGYTQKEAAKILKVDQPKISALKNGRISGFSYERIFQFLSALNYKVEITLQDKNHVNENVQVFL